MTDPRIENLRSRVEVAEETAAAVVEWLWFGGSYEDVVETAQQFRIYRGDLPLDEEWER